MLMQGDNPIKNFSLKRQKSVLNSLTTQNINIDSTTKLLQS